MDTKHTEKGMIIAAGILTGACCAVMVVFPEMAIQSAGKGLRLWAEAVLPALLPFFICANFLTALGVPSLVGEVFSAPFQRVFKAPGSSAFVFAVSVTSGYPMGAKLIADMIRRGDITKEEGRRMLTFCTTSGPLFLLGTIGVSILGSPEAGLAVALAHYGGALLNGWLSGLFTPYQRTCPKPQRKEFPRNGVMETLTASIFSALKTLGLIAAYIVLFTIAADFLDLTGILRPFSGDLGKGIVSGILEITVGCRYIGEAQLPMRLLCTACAFLVSFGGLSVFAQSMSVLAGSGIRPGSYLKAKLCHGLISGLLAYFITPSLLQSTAMTGAFGQAFPEGPVLMPWLFSSQMLCLVLFLLGLSLVFGKK